MKAFLPDMIETKRGHIVTISSVTGLMGTYACTDYSATKFATVGFHESLYSELRYHGHDYIGMTLVCPYYINTGMFGGVKVFLPLKNILLSSFINMFIILASSLSNVGAKICSR